MNQPSVLRRKGGQNTANLDDKREQKSWEIFIHTDDE